MSVIAIYNTDVRFNGWGEVAMHSPIVFIVSDSVGETAEFVVRAAASQFDSGQCEIRRISHVQDIVVIQEVVDTAKHIGAIVAFTLVLPELREYMVQAASSVGIRAVDIMGPMLEAFERIVGQPPRRKAGLVHQLDDDYFRRVEAIEFAVKYDDGRDARGLARADIVLVGVSRTSKTPVSMYLAHKQLKVANVPLVPEIQPTPELFQIDPKKIVGLTIQAEKLNRIRTERLRVLGLSSEATYASPERIATELAYAEGLMRRLGCKVIDVGDKAVEETAGLILEYYANRADR